MHLGHLKNIVFSLQGGFGLQIVEDSKNQNRENFGGYLYIDFGRLTLINSSPLIAVSFFEAINHTT